MEQLAAFLEMGGYGGFVWSAFVVTLVVLVGLLVASVLSLRAREAALTALQHAADPPSPEAGGET